jgi:hypothetical protein
MRSLFSLAASLLLAAPTPLCPGVAQSPPFSQVGEDDAAMHCFSTNILPFCFVALLTRFSEVEVLVLLCGVAAPGFFLTLVDLRWKSQN